MKKFIYIMVTFLLMLILSGCATTPEQRKEIYEQRVTSDLPTSVGNTQFVGSSSQMSSADRMSITGMW